MIPLFIYACLVPRATHRYHGIPDPLTALRLRMRELAQTRIRYGYRKIRVLLIREGWQVGRKLVYRLYREEGLGLRRRRKSRRTVSQHSRQKPRAERPNQVWGLDFVADQVIDGRRAGHGASATSQAACGAPPRLSQSGQNPITPVCLAQELPLTRMLCVSPLPRRCKEPYCYIRDRWTCLGCNRYCRTCFHWTERRQDRLRSEMGWTRKCCCYCPQMRPGPGESWQSRFASRKPSLQETRLPIPK